MPFAGYPNFQACLDANSDKESPGGFCAYLEKKTTGKHSSQMTNGLPAKATEKFWQAFDSSMETGNDHAMAMTVANSAVASLGWVRKKQGWMRQADHKMTTRAVYGVPIFAIGTHNGDKYTVADLKGMVVAFEELAGRLDAPVKIGHTSDEFNAGLAEKMGIVPELLSGEKGNGAMAFGWVSGLRMNGNVLYADLIDVPAPVADLIDSKSYKKVSAEILFDFKDRGKTYPMTLSGLALLGSEIPAVKDSGLETAAVYTMETSPDRIVEFTLNEEEPVTFEQLSPALTDIDEAIDRVMKGKAGVGIIRAMWKELKQKAKLMFDKKQAFASEGDKDKEEEESMNIEILKALGLAAEAKDEDVLAAVKKLAGPNPFAPPGPRRPPAGGGPNGGLSDLEQIAVKLGLPANANLNYILAALEKVLAGPAAPPDLMKQYTDKVASLETENKTLKHDARIAYFKGIAGNLHAISGKPDELAAELLTLEETAGEETAKTVVAKYQDLNKRMVEAGIFKAKGTPAEGDPSEVHEFVKERAAYMKEHQVDEATAQAALRKSKPALFKDYMTNRPRMVVTRAEEK